MNAGFNLTQFWAPHWRTALASTVGLALVGSLGFYGYMKAVEAGWLKYNKWDRRAKGALEVGMQAPDLELPLLDGGSLRAVERYLNRPVAPPDAGALIIVEVDGGPAGVAEEVGLVEEACRRAGALSIRPASSEAEREQLWQARRQLSYALRAAAPRKINHDVSVPRGRVPQLYALIARLAQPQPRG